MLLSEHMVDIMAVSYTHLDVYKRQVPKRGIGLTSINRVQEYAVRHEVGFYEALRAVDLIPNIGRGASKLESFVALIEHFKTDAQEMSISGLMKEIIEETGYVESLEAEDSEEAEARIENIDELMSKIVAYEDDCEDMNEPPTLSGFLAEVALVADIDSLDAVSYTHLDVYKRQLLSAAL